MMNRPPFSVTPRILRLSQRISYALGRLIGEKIDVPPLKLRRDNAIKTIQASLAIEGNTLTLKQMMDIFEGKPVLGPPRDILEVKNALSLYKKFDHLNPLSVRDFLSAHQILMNQLINDAGKWRVSNVGIFKGLHVAHVAPQAKRVPELMENLFHFLKKDKEVSWLLKACIFHYELEFIHPFLDGNGRMGRLWQHLLLSKENPIFKFIAVETLIKNNQEEYYRVLGQCDKEGNSTQFLEFSLSLVLDALESYRKISHPQVKDAASRLKYVKKTIENKWFSRKDYRDVFKDISTATASRDIHFGVENKLLIKKGDKNKSRYWFV